MYLLVEDVTDKFADLAPTLMSSETIPGKLAEGTEDSGEDMATAGAETKGKRVDNSRNVIAKTIRTRPIAPPFLNGGQVPFE